jgi:tetratricopeptide (TPR) repeat protein
MRDDRRASELFERARVADADARWDEAAALYRQSAELAPEWPATWYNLGLIYKRQRRWDESLACNLKALAIDGDDAPTIWNTGIAATFVGDWRAARAAWSRIGVNFPDEEGFVDLRLGLVPIRVSLDEAPEVVWCDRLDPVRARIRNVPLPESKRRYFDVVLNDGEPVGERQLNGQSRAVFNELALLEPSAYGTHCVTVTAPDEEALRALLDSIERNDYIAEDWTSSIRILCKACSEGTVEERANHQHDHADDGWKTERLIAIAAIEIAPVDALLDQWRRDGLRRDVGALERRL